MVADFLGNLGFAELKASREKYFPIDGFLRYKLRPDYNAHVY